jgi:hypothetical protein
MCKLREESEMHLAMDMLDREILCIPQKINRKLCDISRVWWPSVGI